MISIRVLLIVGSLVLGSVACGDGGSNEKSTSLGQRAAAATKSEAGTTSTSPTASATQSTAAADATSPDGLVSLGGVVRLANFYVDANGKGAKVDAYWGSDARADRFIGTLAYGKVGSTTPARGTGRPGADGSEPEVVVSFFVAGRDSQSQRIATVSSSYGSEFRFLIELSWGRSYGAQPDGALRPAATQVIRENDVGRPRPGTAAVIVNNLGAMAIGDGTPLTLGPVAKCRDWVAISDTFESGNAGEVSFEVAPGQLHISGFDPDCKPATTPLRFSLSAGDRVIVFVYGATAAQRRLLAVPVVG